jgi:hypothetical protein
MKQKAISYQHTWKVAREEPRAAAHTNSKRQVICTGRRERVKKKEIQKEVLDRKGGMTWQREGGRREDEEGSRGSAEAGRARRGLGAGRAAEMNLKEKAKRRERRPSTPSQDRLGERRSCREHAQRPLHSWQSRACVPTDDRLGDELCVP